MLPTYKNSTYRIWKEGALIQNQEKGRVSIDKALPVQRPKDNIQVEGTLTMFEKVKTMEKGTGVVECPVVDFAVFSCPADS